MSETLEDITSIGLNGAPPLDGANGLVDKHFLRRGYGVEFEMEADWVRFHLPRTARRVADIGCGSGTLFSAIGTDRVLGVDFCARGLRRTRQRFPSVPLVCTNAVRLPLADARLDAVTVQHVVEHITAYEQACREWLRVLRPGGVLLVLTPNASFRDPTVYADDTHVHLFDADDLYGVLASAGFTVVDLRTIGLPWFRRYHGIPSVWRLRRFVTRRAQWLSAWPQWRWKGQTLCCTARRPVN